MQLEVEPEQAATATVLDAAEESFTVRISSTAGRRMTLSTDRKIPVGVPMKVEWGPFLVLADVTDNISGVVLQIRYALRKDVAQAIRERWF